MSTDDHQLELVNQPHQIDQVDEADRGDREASTDQLPGRYGAAWSMDEYRRLINLMATSASIEEIATSLRRSVPGVLGRVRRLLPGDESAPRRDRFDQLRERIRESPDTDWLEPVRMGRPPSSAEDGPTRPRRRRAADPQEPAISEELARAIGLLAALDTRPSEHESLVAVAQTNALVSIARSLEELSHRGR